MTDTTGRTTEAAPDEQAPDRAPDTAPAPEQAAEDPLAALAKDAAEHKDRWLRALADMENLRRRTERDVAEARLYAITAFARDILVVADNMDRALRALDKEIRDEADAGVKGLLDGVELTERELHKVMEKHGIARIDPQGQKFDPNRHQAMFEIPDPSVPAGTVAQVVQAGYMIGDRVLRPALVGISKGGPRTAPATTAPVEEKPAEAAGEQPANDNTGAGPPGK